MILLPQHILQHQEEEDEEPQQMSPDVDSLVVKFEDALDTVLILQSLPVSRVDGYLFVVVRDLLDAEKLEWLVGEHGVLMTRVVCITAWYHVITGRMLTTMLLHVLHAAHCTPANTRSRENMKRLKLDSDTTVSAALSHNWP